MVRRAGRIQQPGEDQDELGNGTIVEDDDQQDPLGDLAFFTDADDDVEWGVERYKTADEIRQNPRGRNRVFVTKVSGKVDLVAFKNEFGGGLFRFYGKRENGELYGSKKLELAGPRKSYNETEPIAAASPAPAGGDRLTRGERMILRTMRQQNQLLARAEHVDPGQRRFGLERNGELHLPIGQRHDGELPARLQ